MDVIVGDMALSRGRWKVLDTEGWLDTPGFEVPSVERLRHGSLAGPGRATGRTIKISGRVENTDHAQQVRDRNMLAGLFRDGGLVPMSVQLGELKLHTEVRLIDRVTFQPSSFAYSRWELSLYAEDPWLFSAWRESILRPLGVGVGLEYPILSQDLGKGPVVTFGTEVSTQEWVWNDGNADSYPQFEVVGNFPGGFSVGLGDSRVTYPWPTFPDMPVLVDMSGALSVSGVDQTQQLSERNWSKIGPESIGSPFITTIQGGTGWATVRHRDTYI